MHAQDTMQMPKDNAAMLLVELATHKGQPNVQVLAVIDTVA